MKIGLVCPYNIAKGGGVQEIVRAQQAALIRRGHDAYIITPRPRADVSPEPKMIFIGTATDFNSPLHTTVQLSAGDNEAIDEMLEREQFDILHFHEPWVPMLSLQILNRSQTVNVATFHAKLPESRMTRAMTKVIAPYTKSVLRYIHEFTAVSDAAAEYLCSQTDKPVAIIPIGMDLSLFKPPRSFHDKRAHKTILYVGRLEQRKGVSWLLHAFALLQKDRPEVSLVIAGDGPDRSKLEMLAGDLELENIRFLGYVSEEEKVKQFKSANLFCAPALYGESFGIVLLEAMATGLVTVAGDNPGYAGVMQGFGAISLVDPKHSAEFARRLDLLLHETELRKLWRTWAMNEMPQYDNEVIIGQYEEIYDHALRGFAKR